MMKETNTDTNTSTFTFVFILTTSTSIIFYIAYLRDFISKSTYGT